MGIRLKRFPEYGLELYIYSGPISCEEMLRHLQRVDGSADWLSYLGPTADLSGIDVAHFPLLKRTAAAREASAPPKEQPSRHALVTVSAVNTQFVQFWCNYGRIGVPQAHDRVVFSTLEQACRWLGLPPGGCERIAEAAEADAVWTEPEVAGLKASPGSRGPAAYDHPAGS